MQDAQTQTGVAESPPESLYLDTERGRWHALSLGAGERTLIWLHANGFNARTYLPLLRQFSAALPGWRILAPDLRGHGRSQLPADPSQLKSWQLFADDMQALLQQVPGELVLAGHSLGGTVATATAARLDQRLKGLCLVEPVLLPPALVTLTSAMKRLGLKRSLGLAKQARHRRAQFTSPEQAYTGYRGRGIFADWPEEYLRGYLADGLEDCADGGVRLSCDPIWEAAVFDSYLSTVWRHLKTLKCPLVVAAGTPPKSTLRGSARDLLPRLKCAPELTIFADAGHFLPMQRPAEITAWITQAAQRLASLPG